MYANYKDYYSPIFDPQFNQIKYFIEGQIQYGQLNGYNRFFNYRENRVDIGYFKDNEKDGKCIIYRNGNVLTEGVFSNNK